MNISFCQTCKNRLYQLKETIFYNLETIKKDKKSNLILANYDDDELECFVINNLLNHIKDGSLIYLRKHNSPYFEFSNAKNIAHFGATGDFVFNLDCDNFIGQEINSYRSNWEKYPNSVIHGLSTLVEPRYDGSFGRIGMSRDTFNYLGGYDEEIFCVYEDGDLIQRCLSLNMPYAHIYGNRPAIRNSKIETIKNIEDKKLSYDDHYLTSKKMSLEKLKRGEIVRNKNRQKNKITKNFTEEVYI